MLDEHLMAKYPTFGVNQMSTLTASVMVLILTNIDRVKDLRRLFAEEP